MALASSYFVTVHIRQLVFRLKHYNFHGLLILRLNVIIFMKINTIFGQDADSLRYFYIKHISSSLLGSTCLHCNTILQFVQCSVYYQCSIRTGPPPWGILCQKLPCNVSQNELPDQISQLHPNLQIYSCSLQGLTHISFQLFWPEKKEKDYMMFKTQMEISCK